MSGHECSGDCKAYKDKDHPIPGRWTIGELKFQRCPLQFLDPNFHWYFKAYDYMEQGILANPGGWLAQPNKLIEILTYINNELKKREEYGR